MSYKSRRNFGLARALIIIQSCLGYTGLVFQAEEQMLDWINDSSMLSKINLQNIYHKIHIWENDEWKIIFHTQYRHFEYQIVSFNLINTLVIFQVYINHVLHDLVDNFYIVYLDNILVFSKSKKKHYQHLQLIIKHLWHTELYANFKKYEFFKSEIKYFDFLVNKNNLYMNLSCVQIISNWHNYSFKKNAKILISVKIYSLEFKNKIIINNTFDKLHQKKKCSDQIITFHQNIQYLLYEEINLSMKKSSKKAE